MRHVDIQARSVEEAVRLALEQLGRTRDQVKVEVLATDPGGDEVLVRVTTTDSGGGQSQNRAQEEISPRPRQGQGYGQRPQGGGGYGRRDDNRGNRDNRGGFQGDRGNQGGQGGIDRGNRADYMERPPRGGQRYDRYDRPPRGNQAESGPVMDDNFEEDDNRGNRIDGGMRPRTPERMQEAPAVGAVTIDESLQPGAIAEADLASPKDAVAPVAAEILQTILTGMRVRGRIVRREASEEGDAAFPDDSESLVLNVVGLNEREQTNLVGRRGETVDAIQFLLNLVLGRKVDLWARVTVDIEGWRLRRKLSLMNLARRTAEQVDTRKQAIPLEAMPAYERRIIHMTLADHPSVVTESAGVEPERRVVVLPK